MDSALRGYTDKVPLEYAEFCLQREFHMDRLTFERQPAWWVEQAFLFLQREGVYRKSQEQK